MKRIKALALAGAVMLAITVIAGCDEKNAPKVTRETGTKITHETETNITDETGTVMTEPPRTVQGEVPDELTDRGIIIRGEKIQVDSKHSYRKSAVSDIRWQYEYPVNCNLDVESTSLRPHGLHLPGSSIHGIFQARVLEWGATAFSASEVYMHLILRAMFFRILDRKSTRLNSSHTTVSRMPSSA